MTPAADILRELDAAEVFIGVDVSHAGVVGLAHAHLRRTSGMVQGRTLVERLTGLAYYFEVQVAESAYGSELVVARGLLAKSRARTTVLIETQYVAKNVSTAALLIGARARWRMAFEIAAAEQAITVEFLEVAPVSWQAGWLGIASASGRGVLKKASEIAARHALVYMRNAAAETVTGDAADALNMLLWYLARGLNGLARKFGGAKPRVKKARKK